MQSPIKLPAEKQAGIVLSEKDFYTALAEYKLTKIPDDYKYVIDMDGVAASAHTAIAKKDLTPLMIDNYLAWNQSDVGEWANTNYPVEWKRHLDSKKKTLWEKAMPIVITMGAPLAAFGLGAAFLPAVAAEGAGSAFVGGGAIATGAESTVFGVGEFAAYDMALAEGAAAGVGSTAGTGVVAGTAIAGTGVTAGTIATGAGTVVSGIKGASDILGIGAAIKGIAGAVGGAVLKDKLTTVINDVFGGSGAPGAAGAAGGSGGFESGEGGTFNYLPYLLIGLTLLGAFLLSRKGR